MHDLATAEKIVKEARKHGEISSITVEVGDLATVSAGQLKQTLEQLTDWKVKVVEKPANVRCSCGYDGEPKITAREHDVVFYECPRCHEVPEVLDGGDVTIR